MGQASAAAGTVAGAVARPPRSLRGSPANCFGGFSVVHAGCSPQKKKKKLTNDSFLQEILIDFNLSRPDDYNNYRK